MEAKKSRFSLLPLQAAAPALPAPGVAVPEGAGDSGAPAVPLGVGDSSVGSADGSVEVVTGAVGSVEAGADAAADGPGDPVALELPQAASRSAGTSSRTGRHRCRSGRLRPRALDGRRITAES